MAHACYLYSEEAEAGRLLVVDKSGLLLSQTKHTHKQKNLEAIEKDFTSSVTSYFKDVNLSKHLQY